MNLFKRKKVRKSNGGPTEEQLKAAEDFGNQVGELLRSSPRSLSLVGEEANKLMEKNIDRREQDDRFDLKGDTEKNEWKSGKEINNIYSEPQKRDRSGWASPKPVSTTVNNRGWVEEKDSWGGGYSYTENDKPIKKDTTNQMQNFDCGFPYIIIDNFYSKEEEDLVWDEIKFFSGNNKLKKPEDTGGALARAALVNNNAGNKYELKQNKGIFINECIDPSISNIIQLNKKFSDIEYTHDHWYFKSLSRIITCRVGKDGTLLSYYENSDYYKQHVDNGYVTVLTWIYKEPKKFEGGELFFPDFNESVEVKNNRVIIFPSIVYHEVNKIEMNEEDINKGLGRYCISNFTLNIGDNSRVFNLTDRPMQ